jgi:predicted transcriptional regulator
MNIFRFVIPKSLVEYITSDSSVRQALEKMRFHRYAAIPVLDSEGKYIGTLRNDDIFKYFLDNGTFDTKAAENDSIMKILEKDYSKPLYHNASMSELIERVKEHNFVPVVDDRDCFIGIVLRRDILNHLLKYYKEQ